MFVLYVPGDGVAADGAEGGRAVPVPGGEGDNGLRHLPLAHLAAVLLLVPRGHVLVHVLYVHLHRRTATKTHTVNLFMYQSIPLCTLQFPVDFLNNFCV